MSENYYEIKLPVEMGRKLAATAVEMGISPSEAVRRAFRLFEEASKAENISLTLEGGKKVDVRIKK